MGDSKTPRSVLPKTEDIDAEWGGFPDEPPTMPGGGHESDRPTALPPEPPENFARRLMEAASVEEEESGLRSVDGLGLPRTEMPTLIDEQAGTYDLDAVERTIPQVTSPTAHMLKGRFALELPESGGGALDLVGGSRSASTPPSSDPMVEMRDRYAVGDFTGALAMAEKLLVEAPENAEANRYMVSCRDILTQMYTARLGSTAQVPKVVLAGDQIRWLTLDHRSGFLLSCIDGVSSVEEILDVSGMQPLDALRILCELMQQGVIEMRLRK